MLRCYNIGCGKTFLPSENLENSCIHHSKPPYFHDAYKIWPCCNKKSIDFSEFLSIPGCTVSRHNPNQNDEMLSDFKNKLRLATDSNESFVIKPASQHSNVKIAERKSFDMASSSNFTIIAVATKELISNIEILEANKRAKEESKRLENILIESMNDLSLSEDIQVGTECRRMGCTKQFTCFMDSKEECCYHDGFPVFHDGSKYWSCCKIKCSDFNEFVRQKGCCIALHDFVSEKKSFIPDFRMDFYQQGNFVTATFFAKMINYQRSVIIVDGFNLYIDLIYGTEEKRFTKVYCLFEGVIPEKSFAVMTPYKLDIKLTIQPEGILWPQLEYLD